MRFSLVDRAIGCQCKSSNSPGFDACILRHSGIRRVVDKPVLKNVHKKIKKLKNFRHLYLEAETGLFPFKIGGESEKYYKSLHMFFSSLHLSKNLDHLK
jgi:hypothetical protein